MSDANISWLAEAAEHLRHYHVEMDSAMRRLAWGERLSSDHVTALIDVMCKADKIGPWSSSICPNRDSVVSN